jgi:hypothetical protein
MISNKSLTIESQATGLHEADNQAHWRAHDTASAVSLPSKRSAPQVFPNSLFIPFVA